MIEKLDKHEEVYNVLHRWDTRNNRHHDWESDVVENSTSGHIRGNPLTGPIIRAFNPFLALILDSHVIARNWRNWRVKKNYNDHPM